MTLRRRERWVRLLSVVTAVTAVVMAASSAAGARAGTRKAPAASPGADVRRCPPVAFIKRKAQGRSGTNATMLARATAVGSAICIYDPARPEQGARTVFDAPEGFIFDMSPSFDARRLVFAFKDKVRQRKDSFHIWESNTDGTGLKQLTKGPYHDVSPVYLPDGRIVFNSTRVESFSLCQDYLAAALYVIDADGGNLRRLEYNTLSDCSPSVMDDGSILFSRWEYQDKNIFCVQGLWTINPNGSRLQLFYGNTLTVPNAIYGAKQIPGTHKVVCTMAAHHHRPLGAVAIIDRSKGLENAEAMVNITPEVPYTPTVGRNWRETNWGPGDKLYPWSYADPWPIAEDLFLVAYGGPMEGGPKRYRLYLLDAAGRKTPLYEDPQISCFNPVPLRPRRLPQIFPGQAPRAPRGHGMFYIHDIYQGLENKGVARGQVKALRIMSQTPKKYNTEGPRYHDHYPVMGHGSYYAKYTYGTVPIYEDGSAYFMAPAGVELYWIALDSSGKEIRRMGSITQITAGEIQGCIGCHESRFTAPPIRTGGMDRLATGPDRITPEPWGAGPVDFVKQVQPVFDRYCVRCHSGRTPKAGLDLSGDKSRFFSMAFDNLTLRNVVEYYYINKGPTGNFPPMASGSWVSKLTKMIESNHSHVSMDDQSRRRIYYWIDANAPYYPTWDMSRPHTQGGRDTWSTLKGHRPGPEAWFEAFAKVYKPNCGSCHAGLGRPALTHTWINLTRPDFSRVLNAHLAKAAGGMGITNKKGARSPPVFTSTRDPVYASMREAIRAGKKALDAKPRMDMAGGVPIPQERNFGKTF